MGEYFTKPVCKVFMLKGEKGLKGDKGPKGENGLNGKDGLNGEKGEGIPTGGTTGQFLKKKSNTDYEYEWADITPASFIPNSEIDAIMKE
nr:MAG TPA_asm: nucleoid-associated protein [Caudoviricetes sp.]